MSSRTYTPPTCTLKVTARGLALLRWFGIPRKQRFSLSFDDPRVSEAEHITVKGDRRELDTLHKVVTTYVQEFLDKSPNLPSDMENTGEEKNSNIPLQDPVQDPDTKIQEDTMAEDTIESADGKVVNPYSQPPIKNQNIYVQPRDLLTHDLFLGSLANKESGKFISLSMLQLFDLAIALDECHTDLEKLPQFQSNGEVKAIPEWLRTAILIIITAGLTAGGIQLYNRYVISQQKQNEKIATSDNNQSIPPQTSPTPTQLPTPNVPPSPLPTPPTNLPTTTIIKPSPIATPSPLFPQPNSPASPAPNNLPPPDFSRTPQNQGNATTFVIPPAPPLTPPPIPPAAIPNYGVPVQPVYPVQPPPSLQIQPAPNQAPLPNVNRRRVEPYLDVSRIPINVPRAIDLPPLPDVDPVALRDIPTTVEPSNEEKKSKYTLFDRIPQVAEVREYFEKSWEPPSDLKKDLQYSLLLNGDGSVKKVTPISQASVEFYGNTNMPLEEEVFVSNIEGGKTAKIRLVLSRDGEVKTFLESLN
ncbi:MAG: DUF4335 domain-containing protein [Okeania sp. SIO3I5]|uniref:DUF4335 domain-containing protein n=1 Tax=Okeania sp. SIO3I5 TaxID=2607805 RepID=UPI0013BB9314|nr:DUF4335 domain-containing protein [Okeania sp. SIO3I5]NEQ38928.1 DUF4335 domain-containing protein [Okeania sp. SIO3I5]